MESGRTRRRAYRDYEGKKVRVALYPDDWERLEREAARRGYSLALLVSTYVRDAIREVAVGPTGSTS